MIKHGLASGKDTKPTIVDGEMRKIIGKDYNFDEVDLFYPLLDTTITYHSSRGGKTWYPSTNPPPHMVLPKVGIPVYYDVVLKHKLLEDELLPIRQWAYDKGILTNGDVKTQTLKLMEEVGELSKSILKQDDAEFIDAIGDCVVVLTNLAALNGYKIEDCINSAYNVIKNRTGKMVNNTFVKDGQ
jgi:NTP pyrophosphatase (non-canonical NTP hydrolase)